MVHPDLEPKVAVTLIRGPVGVFFFFNVRKGERSSYASCAIDA